MKDETPISSVIRQCYERNLAFWFFNQSEVLLRGAAMDDNRTYWSIYNSKGEILAESYSSPFVAISRYKEQLELWHPQPGKPRHIQSPRIQSGLTMTNDRMVEALRVPNIYNQPPNPDYKRTSDGRDWRWNKKTELWDDISWARDRLNPPPRQP